MFSYKVVRDIGGYEALAEAMEIRSKKTLSKLGKLRLKDLFGKERLSKLELRALFGKRIAENNN